MYNPLIPTWIVHVKIDTPKTKGTMGSCLLAISSVGSADMMQLGSVKCLNIGSCCSTLYICSCTSLVANTSWQIALQLQSRLAGCSPHVLSESGRHSIFVPVV